MKSLLLYSILATCFTVSLASIQEYLKFSDLKGLRSSPNQVYHRFRRLFGTYPDGLSLNYENYRGGRSITSKNGVWCHKILGETKYAVEKTSAPAKTVMGSDMAYNRGSSPATVSLAVSGQWGETVGYSSSITTGMTFSEEFSIEGIFKIGGSFSFSATATSSKTKTESHSYTSTVTVTVPPHCKKRVSVVANMRTVTMDFRKPITVSGRIGANFPHRVRGHYYWFVDIRQLVPTTTGEISGRVHGSKAFDLHTEIDDAIPIESEYED